MSDRSRCLALLAVLSISLSTFACAADFTDGFEFTVSPEPADLAGITARHNSVRSAVATLPPLLPLTWSATLAQTAQSWANQCRDIDAPAGLIDHNPNRSVGHPYYVGENVFASSGSSYPTTSVVDYWASESQYYNYAANSCTSGQQCGHYTQLVWRTTAFVGCARSDCPALAYRYSVVCNYGPGGNTGGRPY